MVRKSLAVVIAVFCGAVSAHAGEAYHPRIDIYDRPSYDRNLEQAVMRIVAHKIGTIRGGLDKDIGPVLVAAENFGWPLSLMAHNLAMEVPLPAKSIIYASITH